jgi:hypothetical protein
MRVKELLQLIPEEELNVLAIETQVNHQVKKLSGLIMFQLILFSMINRKRISLRVMEEFLRTAAPEMLIIMFSVLCRFDGPDSYRDSSVVFYLRDF